MTFWLCASLLMATATALDTQPVIMMALFCVMKRVWACTAVLGFASLSATPCLTSLPSTPFLVCGEIFLIRSLPSLRCSIASS